MSLWVQQYKSDLAQRYTLKYPKLNRKITTQNIKYWNYPDGQPMIPLSTGMQSSNSLILSSLGAPISYVCLILTLPPKSLLCWGKRKLAKYAHGSMGRPKIMNCNRGQVTYTWNQNNGRKERLKKTYITLFPNHVWLDNSSSFSGAQVTNTPANPGFLLWNKGI